MADLNERKVVLLAEDDSDQAFLARKMLEREGYVVITAQDGEQALTLTDVVRPSAMVLDLVMPGMDGFEVLKALRERDGPRPLVVAVSALRGYLPKARELGADDALRKPYSTKLVGRLRGLMNGQMRGVVAAEEEERVDLGQEMERRESIRSATTKATLDLIGGVGSPPDPVLQDLTERAARIFDVRACLVSLVTADHDFWPAGCGLQGAPGRVADRRSSVCSHAIYSRAAIVVHDAEENPFFKDSEAREMGIRFYAAVPLTSRTGEPLGSVCLLDHRPRDFSWIELELLGTFASVVMGAIEWRERTAYPSEPISSFRHLDAVDLDLGILGRDGFHEALRHLSDRAAEYPEDLDAKVSLVVIECESGDLAGLTRNLQGSFPVALFGRLGVDRLAIAVVGTEADVARRLARKASSKPTKLQTADASDGSVAAVETLRFLEASIESGPLSTGPDGELFGASPPVSSPP